MKSISNPHSQPAAPALRPVRRRSVEQPANPSEIDLRELKANKAALAKAIGGIQLDAGFAPAPPRPAAQPAPKAPRPQVDAVQAAPVRRRPVPARQPRPAEVAQQQVRRVSPAQPRPAQTRQPRPQQQALPAQVRPARARPMQAAPVQQRPVQQRPVRRRHASAPVVQNVEPRFGFKTMGIVAGVAVLAVLLTAAVISASPAAESPSKAKASSAPAADSLTSTSRELYKSYVADQMELAVGQANELSKAIDKGDLGAAQKAYIDARAPYERVWPVAEQSEILYAKIQAPEFSTAADAWTGYHRIEKGLFQVKSTSGLGPVASELATNLAALQVSAKSADLTTLDLAEGAAEMLNQASQHNIYGEEDKYAGSDLADIQATLDGAKAAFDGIRPAVTDAAYLSRVDTGFETANASLAGLNQNGEFVKFQSASRDDIKNITYAIDSLGEILSLAPGKVTTSN